MNQWWIDENKVKGSKNPTPDELKALYHDGFRTVISLLVEHKQHPKCSAERAKSIGFKRFSIPIEDGCAPTPDQYDEFLSIIRDAERSGKILIHCEGGLGRTGTMGAAYWIGKRFPADKAIMRIKDANLGAIEKCVQVQSLYELEARLNSTGTA